MRQLPVPPGDDEIAHLGGALNSMLARIETSFRNERAFVDDASHELRTPLAILAGEIELGLLNTTDEATRAILESLREETDRLAHLADDLLVLARSSTVNDRARQPTLVVPVVDDVVARLRSVYGGLNIAVLADTGSSGADSSDDRAAFATWTPPEHLQRIATNLVENACRFARQEVRVRVGIEDAAYLVLQVADDGPGFAEEVRETAFERFTVGDRARTRAVGTVRGGTGLGLAIVRTLAERSGGTAEIETTSPLGGAAVRVRLRVVNERVVNERVVNERVVNERVVNERVATERVATEGSPPTVDGFPVTRVTEHPATPQQPW
jgi:two-component system, OmpR family, sensor kinase